MNKMIENNTMEKRSSDFINNLYEEKIKHKEHRHEFVKNKLLFTIGLFSIGSLKIMGADFNVNLSILLYFIPLVALSFDIYIFSEDFKVKRIGVFIRECCECRCNDEKRWEYWLTENNNREKLAHIASLGLTIITLIASLILLLIYKIDSFNYHTRLFWWFISCAFLITIVFIYEFYRRHKLLNNSKNFAFLSLTRLRFPRWLQFYRRFAKK
jgi:hypothetical protein